MRLARPTILLTAAAILIVAMTSSAPGQISEAEKALAPVRPEDRAPLIRLLNDYLRFQQSQQWGSLYDSLSPTYTRGETRDNFIRRLQSSHEKGQYIVILDFSLKRTYGNDPFHGEYSFYGCANVFTNGKKQLANTHIDVALENGAWRVSFVGLFTTCQPPELECKNTR